MGTCTACGHHLDTGRFCLNCGTPVAAGPTAPPPSAAALPGSARFPLYADEVPASAPPTAPAAPVASEHPVLPRPTAPPPQSPPAAAAPRRQRIAWLPLAVAALALLLVAGLGTLLLIGIGPDDDGVTAADAGATPTPTDPVDRVNSSLDPSPSGANPSPTPPIEEEETESVEEPQNLVRFAVPDVPDTAPPNQDLRNRLVRYDARNMIDGVPETTWRTPGDATGSELVLTFPEAVTLSRIGLINGYAKKAGEFDWYQGNRRIDSVTWTFDDGTTVSQSFAKDRAMQSLDIDPVTTITVRIRLDAVTSPGSGKAARNNTAISDVLLFGVPA